MGMSCCIPVNERIINFVPEIEVILDSKTALAFVVFH